MKESVNNMNLNIDEEWLKRMAEAEDKHGGITSVGGLYTDLGFRLKQIDRVTMTGADDSTNPQDLLDLSIKYKFVEWGILISKQFDKGIVSGCRFPSLQWYNDKLKPVIYNANFDNIPFNLSLHVCGKLVKQICDGNAQSLIDIFSDPNGPSLKFFKRIQLNFHGLLHNIDKDQFINALNQIRKHSNVTFIFQLDNVNNEIFEYAIKNNIPAVPLFDLSHGGGILPEKWPNLTYEGYAGFSGGLGPENLEAQIPLILEANPGREMWLDMETKIRSDNDYLFDLKKVETCLIQSLPYIR
jgi:hypothetical protein